MRIAASGRGDQVVPPTRRAEGTSAPAPVAPSGADRFEAHPVDPSATVRLGAPSSEEPFPGLRDAALEAAIRGTSASKRVLSYSAARRAIFGELDGATGTVRDVYTHRTVKAGKPPSSSVMNIEHTWPQSQGATGAAKSDLHHLYPTDSKANGLRGSLPFGEVLRAKWSSPSGAKMGTDATGRLVFEPPDEHKGNVARAMFYFATEYRAQIGAAEEAVLRAWNAADAVDLAERQRNATIQRLQGNSNQFVEHPELEGRISDF